MVSKFNDLVESACKIQENEGVDKVVSLKEAIKRNVRPGAKIHLGTTHCCPNAAILEITRQFYGQQPNFTLIMRGIRDTAIILIHARLVKKVITSFSGDVYPWYRANQTVQRAYASGEVEVEDWSILTLPLMLMAGALGVSCMPTTSIMGSSMENDNRDSFKVIDDPFGSGKRIGLLKALNPDISIIHGLAADRVGNTILTPPYSEGLWGSKASTEGVIVTVEKLVSTDFIREHSHLVRLPGYMVNSVSLVPLGAHPGGMWNLGIRELDVYAEDYDFMTKFNKRCKSSESLEAWIKEWVVDCQSFDEYKAKLGRDRIVFLKGNADKDAWKYQLYAQEQMISESEKCSANEMIVIAAARKIKDKILRLHYKTILGGAGIASLAAWIAKYQLQREGCNAELMVELGHYGASPRPSEPFLLNFGNFVTCKMLTDTLDTLGVFACGATNRCLGVLGGGQVDKFGNVNSTKTAGGSYLTGSGGANDVASGASEVVLVMKQSRERFLEKVPYITAPGKSIKTIISSMGIFEKLNNEEEFTLTGYFASQDLFSVGKSVEKIRKNCGWDLKVADDLHEIPLPTLEELRLLRIFDPMKYYI